MKKREIHAMDFVVARVVTLLELVLLRDDRFVISRKTKKLGVDTFACRADGTRLQILVRPKWWPDGCEMKIYTEKEKRDASMLICLNIPCIQEFDHYALALGFVDLPPFFDARHLRTIDPEADPEAILLFEKLRDRVFKEVVAA
jgi:hypothetical protein